MAASNSNWTLVLVGKTGNGKSATGNSILGKRAFVSKVAAKSVTTNTKIEEGLINIIDTPGLFDTKLGHDAIGKEVVKCIELAKNGIHAVLIVLSVTNRFSPEEETAIYSLQSLFGSKIFDWVIVVFTGGDNLGDEDEEEDQVDEVLLQEYIRERSPRNLQQFIQLCGNRVVLFDNKTKDKSKKSAQVATLVSLVEKVLADNGGEPYTHKYFGKARLQAIYGWCRKLHGKDVAHEAAIAAMKEKIQLSYDEQLKQMAAQMEATLKATIAQMESRMAADQSARLQAQIQEQAAGLNAYKEMIANNERNRHPIIRMLEPLTECAIM